MVLSMVKIKINNFSQIKVKSDILNLKIRETSPYMRWLSPPQPPLSTLISSSVLKIRLIVLQCVDIFLLMKEDLEISKHLNLHSILRKMRDFTFYK